LRLLLVEDDVHLSTSLKKSLESSGFAVDIANNGIDAEYLGNEINYDIVILDLGLPGKDGLSVLKNWRQNLSMPVIVLTARDAWYERVDGLKAGADDYLGKPFHIEELLARISALLNRTQNIPREKLVQSDIVLDEEKQKLIISNGSSHQLTSTEFRLIRYFLLNPDKLLSKSVLTEHIYEFDADKDSNVIEVYIRRLRQMIGKNRIQTRRNQGYIFISSA